MPKSRKLPGLVISLTMFGVVALAWVQRQAIYDWSRLHNYHPPAAAIQLATDTTMNAYARNIFLVQHPEVDNKSTFNDFCRETSEQTIVLGCYISRQGIYVLDVQEAKLAGIEQVTAAHEMLHAAYDRLGAKDRKIVDDMINQAYKTITDKRIKATVEQYKKAGADVTNELHSILGTEVRNLPPDLEAYYKKYFTNRAAIVDYSEKYEQIFTDNKNKVDKYDQELSQRKKQIEALQVELDALGNGLEAARNELERELAAKDYAAYNNGVPSYNTQVNIYNAKVKAAKQKIAEFNTILDQRNAIALEDQQLYKAIDSRYDSAATK